MSELEALFDDLKKELAALPPMTPREREEQSFSFAYGNLACTTNHKPTRRAFARLAQTRGWSLTEFFEWAEGRTWW